MSERRDSDKKKFLIAFIVIWVVQMAAAFYFCTQKQGFHEDEYYTYYSTSRTNGFYVEDGAWMDREDYLNEFVVLPNERFQYGLVRLVQSWDVHPPMYYWVFHTVASLAPNVFSKWIGLSVNLFFHGINIILLTYLSYLVVGRGSRLSLFVTLFWGLSPAVMSGVVFIRMYEMLTTFVLVCAILHVNAVRENETKLPVFKCVVPMAAVTYIGFLTQYYYFIFLFYLAIAFCVWFLWRDRNIWNCLRYGIGQAAALVLAYLTYPSCLAQMFRGQRGAQATENFFDLSNTFERIGFFYDLMDRCLFGQLLSILLLLIVILAVTDYMWNKRDAKGMTKQTEATVNEQYGSEFDACFWMLAFASVGYFLTVSKTALLLGDTSIRYQLPIYGIAVILVFDAISILWRRVSAACAENGISAKCLKYMKYADAAAALICFAVILPGYRKDGVEFLYPEDKEQVAFAGECAKQGIPAVYLYQPGEEWCIWDVADELFMYPKVYFAAVNGDNPLDSAEIQNMDSFVVYIAGSTGEAEQGIGVFTDISDADSGTRMSDEKYCSVWYLE